MSSICLKSNGFVSWDLWGFQTSKRCGDIHLCLLVSHISLFVLAWLGLDFLFHFSSFILHLLFCLLCFNQWDALTTRLSFVLPSGLPLVPLVSSNTHFFSFFCVGEIFPMHTGKQQLSNSRWTISLQQVGEPTGKATDIQTCLTPTICPKLPSQLDSRKRSLFPPN